MKICVHLQDFVKQREYSIYVLEPFFFYDLKSSKNPRKYGDILVLFQHSMCVYREYLNRFYYN